MVRGVVPEEDSVVLPTWTLSVQRLRQRLQEERDDVRVGGCVSEREPALAGRVEGGDHRQSWRHCVEPDITSAVSRSPSSPDEGRLVKPGLVDVDDPLAFLKKLEHFYGVLLAEHPAAAGIRLRNELPRLDVPQLAFLR